MNIFQIFWSTEILFILLFISAVVIGITMNLNRGIETAVGVLGFGMLVLFLIGLFVGIFLSHDASEYFKVQRIVRTEEGTLIAYLPDGKWVETHVDGIVKAEDKYICVKKHTEINMYTKTWVKLRVSTCNVDKVKNERI